MIKGTFIANIDPPFIEFVGEGNRRRRACTLEELRLLLVEIDVMDTNHRWPLREYILRMPIEISREKLAKLGILDDQADKIRGN